MKTLIAVVGSSQASKKALSFAFETGKEIIKAGFCLICGGLSGVMEAASRGAQFEAGSDSGRIIGILPGTNKKDANPYIDIVIPTGLGYARNMVIASSCDAVIAIAGGSGTLSEVALAWQYGKPIVVIEDLFGITAMLIQKSLDNRRKNRILGAKDAKEAVMMIKKMLSH